MDSKVKIPTGMFVFNVKNGTRTINAPFFNNNMWFTQKQIAEIFETDVSGVSRHISNILAEGEIDENKAFAKFAKSEKSESYPINPEPVHYSLDVVISVGYRVNSKKATEFRIWATKVLNDYIQKGFALDDERFKQGYQTDKQYFKELRERIKEIRASERMLYQQIKDIYALSADYDNNRQQTMLFFAKVQNKLLFAISGKTGPEIIHSRVDSNKENIGLTSFKNSPDGRVTKQDVEIAKNYLQEPEMKELRYIVNLFLDYAEHKAESEEKIFMKDWEVLLDDFLAFNKKEILPKAGSISLEKALEKAHNEYFKYRENLKLVEKKNSEIEYKEDIKELEKILKTTE